MLGDADEVDAALVGAKMPVDALLNAGAVPLEQILCKHFAAKETVEDDQRVCREVLLAHDGKEDRPLDQLTVDLHPARRVWPPTVVGTDHVAER